jgi:hypothetical protein
MSEVKISIRAQNQASGVLKQVDSDIKKTTNGWRGKFTQFTEGVRGMFGGGPVQNAIGGFLAKLGPIGAGVAAVTAAIAAGIGKAAQFADTLKDGANVAGLSFKAFQNLGYIAGENGIKTERLTAIMNKFQASQNEIASNKNMQKAYKALGVSVEEVAALSPEKLLERVAQGFKKTGDIGALYDIFGKGAGEVKMLLSDIAQTGGGLNGIVKGNIVSDDALTALNRLSDGFNNLKRSAGSALTEIAGRTVLWAQGITGFWKSVASGTGMELASDMIGKSQDAATKKVLDNKKAEEEAAAAARKRAVEEAKAEEAKKAIKEDNAKLDKIDQGLLAKNADDQKRIQNEQKTFEGQMQALGRKRQDLFDPRGDMTAEDLQKEQAGRILNTRSDMQARRSERNADRTRKRMERLAEQAQFVEARGGTVSRRGRMAREFMERQQRIADAQKNIDQRKKQAEEAQIKATEIQEAMKHRQDWMIWTLEDQLTKAEQQRMIEKRIADNTDFLKNAVTIEGGE